MKQFSIKQLSRILDARIDYNTAREPVAIGRADLLTAVSTDSRNIKPGDCFFAIPGGKFDGHDYITEAFAKGAACVVVSREVKGAHDKPVLKVDDTIKALGDFAGYYRRESAFKVVAITGSVGKTTTRQIIYHVLGRHYRVKQSPRSFNNNIGLPLTLLDAEPDDDIVVAELGANHPGEIAYLARIAQPDIAVVTNVHPAHLEGFGDLQTIIREKLSIAEGLSPNGVLIINGDIDALVHACRVKAPGFCTFGKSTDTNYSVTDISYSGFNSLFTIDGLQVHLPLPGPGNVENALAAWAVCSRFGLSIEQFAAALQTLTGVAMRAEAMQIGTLTLLNDCYNANPASMRNALDILAGLGKESDSTYNGRINSQRGRRLVFVCGDMAELGTQSEPLHAQLGVLIAKAGMDLLVTVGQFGTITAASAKKSAEKQLLTVCFPNTTSACNSLHELIKERDIILVKGSRAAGLEAAVEKLKELYAPAKVPYPIEELSPDLAGRRVISSAAESRTVNDRQ